jgi:Tol biopolymer transport system component
MTLAAALAIYVMFWRSTPVTKESTSLARDFEITQLTTSGNAITPAISPDGRYVAYVQPEEGSASLWIRQVADSEPRARRPA